MEQELINCLINAEFEESEKLLCGLENAQIKDILLSTAFESESIAVLGFAEYMFYRSNDYFWCGCIISLLLTPLCFLEGAYSLAFHYAKMELQHERSVENLIQLLFFQKIPEKLLDDAQAAEIAKEILLSDPDNETARSVLANDSRN